jgi:hypothetical protein
METKFIEGTDEKYSIREDGQVTRNWTCRRGKYKPGKKVFSKRVMKVINHGNNYLASRLLVNNKQVVIILKNALYEYFIGKIPPNHKVVYNKSTFPINLADLQLVKQDKNSKINMRKRFSRYKEELSKAYIANLLSIKVKQLSNELYEHHKNLVLFKRQIAKEHNIKISSLK